MGHWAIGPMGHWANGPLGQRKQNDCILFNIIKSFLGYSIEKEGIRCHPVLRSLLCK